MGKSYEKGLVLFRQRRYRQAMEQFQAELAEQPNSLCCMSMLGLSLLNDKQIDAAHAEVSEAIRIRPQYAFAFYAMAYVQMQKPTRKKRVFQLMLSNSPQEELRRRYKLALKSIDQAIALAPRNPDFFALRASLLGAMRYWRAALAAAEVGLQIDPNHIDCANQRAAALRKLGKVHEAESETKRSLTIDPEHPFTHRTRGWLMLHYGKPAQAVRHFTEALRIDPLNRNAKKGLFHAKLANHLPGYRWLLQGLMWVYSVQSFFVAILVGCGVLFGVVNDHLGAAAALVALCAGLGLLIVLWAAIKLTARRRAKAPRALAPAAAEQDVG